MWKLIKHKEKNEPLMLLIYVVTFIIYALLEGFYYTPTGPIFFVVWVSFVGNIFRRSIFHLDYYYSTGNDYSLQKNLYVSQLLFFLKMLSIKMSDFVKYNVLYAMIKLIPFVIVSLIFCDTSIELMYIVILVLFFSVFAYTTPMSNILFSVKRKMLLEHKDYSKKEKREVIEKELQSLYPSLTYKKIGLLQGLLLFSYFTTGGFIYLIIFDSLFQSLSRSNTFLIVLCGCGFIIALLCGYYINHLERESEYELYQS